MPKVVIITIIFERKEKLEVVYLNKAFKMHSGAKIKRSDK